MCAHKKPTEKGAVESEWGVPLTVTVTFSGDRQQPRLRGGAWKALPLQAPFHAAGFMLEDLPTSSVSAKMKTCPLASEQKEIE